MSSPTENEESQNREKTDFIVKLENAATLFLNLLHLSKCSKTDLSSISAVSDVFKFLHCDSRLRHITDAKEATTHTQTKLQTKDKPSHTEPATRRRKPLQSSSSGGQKAVSAIVMAVKNRCREKVAKHRGQDHVTEKKATNRIRLRITKKVLKKYESVDDSLAGADNEDEKQFSNDSGENNEKHTDATTAVPNALSELQCPHCFKAFIDKRNLRSHLWIHEREKRFQCDVCQKQFLRTHQLTRHKRVHTGERPYPCTVCGKAFADVSNLNTHKRKEHPKHETLVLKCEECGKECQSKKGLKIHLREHEDQDVREQSAEETPDTKPCLVTGHMSRQVRRLCTAKNLCREKEVFLCQICGKGLNKRAALLAHMKRHIHKRNFRCEFCNKVFPELSELKTHHKGHTGDRPYKCQKCGKGFKSQGTLRSHLGVHTGEQPYKCDVCGRSFSQTSGLNQHKLKHTAEEEKAQRCRSNNNANDADSPNNCDICGRCYKTKFRLQLHLKSHDSKWDVSCDFCEKKFQTAHDLAIHRRSHTKDKYSCRVCGASFKSRSVYYFHTRTHQVDRPYLCSSCGKSFISANDLTAHKRRHVAGNAFKRQHDQFICNVCGKVYQMKNSLLIHMKIHQGIFDHPCDFCEKKFKSHAELRHHRRVHTLEKPYVCETCDRRFSRHSTLVNHRRTHSGERPYMCPTCGAAFKLSCTLKKHAKIHTRENQGHKVRFNSGRGRGRNSNLEPPPSTPDLYPTQPHHEEQTLKHQQQELLLQQLPHAAAPPPQTNPSMSASLPGTITTTIRVAAPHLMQKPNNQHSHFIHELKPASTNIIQMDSTAFISNVSNILIDPRNPVQIQQPMREVSNGDAGEKEAIRDLTEMQNIVPNSAQYVPGSSTFTTYYYY